MKVIAIVGPTAVGKSSLAIRLAKALNGEIISCDSMQVYRTMDIGTAKATKDELSAVPHHLIDILDPNESFSCADYAVLAKEAIENISSRQKTPIFCGGTGLYLDSVIEIPSFCDTAKDEKYRHSLELFASENGNSALHKMLTEIDPESAEATHENNVKRVIRALEIYKCTGITKSEWDRRSRLQAPPYEAHVFFLTCEDKALLYKKIEERVDIMIASGLIDEARALYENGSLSPEKTASGAIGYKEFIPYFKGADTLENCIAQLKLSTRHYAKRQLTWFSRKKNYHKIPIDTEDAFSYIMRFLGETK
ncbi:MAG: tRNA (adenosine(37)-N6)-dimethylallyltransferase MiaA [Clostridia bacterium]|nr:tRNA (adenosine(37)-N6)-dimethylallyltransferase MiaA [Clostridia bacterium]MBO5416024.1 tRNA (adenosine(37)-N6)-dimethylallyltransferase MiaA [Clostridia bacterium]